VSTTAPEKPKIREPEWKQVATAPHFPTSCVICQNHKGPFVDTEIDRYDLHFYLCRGCVKKAAESMGFAEGEKLDQLENASEERARLEEQLRFAEAQTQAMGQKLTESKRSLLDTTKVLQDLQGQREQERHLIGQIVSAANQL
jgi:ribosomal protein S14